jgi:two-component system phosphate regulon sensor histidine kinase PhoR
MWGVAAAGSVVLAALAALVPQPQTKDSRRTSPASTSSTEGVSATAFAATLFDPVIFFDRGGRVIEANRAAAEAFGRVESGTVLLLKFRAPDMQSMIRNLLAGGKPASIDYAERVPLERSFRVSASAIGDRDDLFALVFKDQSEVRRIDRMRADFIANASHELRTPLASISGFIETLRGSAKDDPKAREQFLGIMQNQAGRMARLLDDLLSLSRLEMKPRLDGGAQVDLNAVVRDVAATMAPMAADAKVTIEIAQQTSSLRVVGDRDELFQVVQNLVENACKYGRSGERVVISSERHADGGIELVVTDFGPGIAAEHIPRITERFYRVEAEGGRTEKGTGLGLAIVKHILARHNARLNITSEPGKQTRFVINFPQDAPAA